MPEKLTDQTPYVGEAPSNAIFHMVDPSDTTDDPDGSSFSVEKSQIVGTGNIPTKFVYCEVDFSTAGSTITKVQDVINALPTFTLGRTIYKFYTLRFEEITGGIGSGGGPGFRATIDFYELVKNFESLGSGGTQLTGAAYTNIRLTSRITNEDTGIGSRSLGEQGTTPIEDAVDATGPHDVSPGFFNLFDLTRSGVSYTYLYVGEKEIVGSGEDPTVNGDYVPWPTDSAEDDGPPDEPINPQEYPQVTDAEIAAGTETGIRLFSPDNVKDMVDTHALAAVGNPTKLKGEWDASSGTFPGGGTAKSGDSYIVSVSGTVDGVAFTAKDRIIAITDNASTTTFAANWFKADYTDVYQTDAEIETAYNNQVGQVSAGEKTAGTETAVRRFSPKDVKEIVEKHTHILNDTTPKLGGELDMNGHSVGGDAQTATGDGSTTIDWKLGNFFHFQFGAFNETFTFTSPTRPGFYHIKLVQDSSGSRTATWPGTVKWPGGTAPTLTTTATTGTDIITFYFDGTNYFGVEALNFS